MAEYNQYQAPGSKVDDVQSGPQEFAQMKILSAKGRIGRIRYLAYGTGVFFIIYVVTLALTFLLGMGMGRGGAVAGGGLMVIAYLVMLVYSVMLAIRRSHDFNASGWLSILVVIPLINLIFIFIPGTKGSNDYGPPPPPNTTGNYVLGIGLPVFFVVAGILAAIAIPAYQGYIEKSKELQQQQLQQNR